MNLTILYYTANVIPEKFMKSTKKQLLSVTGDYPIISVSQKPIDLGENICVGEIGVSVYSLYWQVWEGVKHVKTQFVAMAEDDILYPPGYYDEYRPDGEYFAYNTNKWGIYTWSNPPIFSFKHNRLVLSNLICPAELLLEAMTERFTKWPKEEEAPLKYFAEPGRDYDQYMDCTVWPRQTWESKIPNIAFSHPTALGYGKLGKRKGLGEITANTLPYWGTAEEVVKRYG